MPFEPGSPEWHEHVAEIARKEEQQPYRWWYLSFARDDPDAPHGGFLGAAIVRARGFTLAVQLTRALGINPGDCEVRGNCLGEDEYQPPAELTGRLLSWEDLEEAFGELTRWSEFDEVPMPLSRCLRCHYEVDASTGVGDTAMDERPVAGSIVICAKCGAVAQYGEALQVVPLDFDHLMAIESSPRMKDIIRRVQAHLRFINASKN